MALTSSQLALLVAIERTGSLARAALSLDVTPPAISQQLARIEREVGVTLVERGARGAKLTALGHTLAQCGMRVAEELQRADEAAAEFVGMHANRLRVGALNSTIQGLVSESLAAIRHQFPEAELFVVDVASGEGIDLVVDGGIDVAVVASYGAPWTRAGVHLQRLLTDPMMVVLPDDHPLASPQLAEVPIDLTELREDAWVCGAPGKPHRAQLDDSAAERGFIPNVPFQTESYDVAQSLAVAGVAVALVPRMAVRTHQWTITRPVAGPVSREVYAVVPNSIDHVPLAGHFLRFLAQAAETVDSSSAAADG